MLLSLSAFCTVPAFSVGGGTITQPPTKAPTNFLATPGNTQVSLSWNSVNTATSYNLWRKKSTDTSFTKIKNLSGTSYLNTGLTNGVLYNYAINAANLGGASSAFSYVDATPVVPPTPTPANRAPVANAQSVTTLEDTAKTIMLSATDADNNPLTYSVVAAPIKGALSGTAPNLTYTPMLNQNGTDSFTFKANDGSLDSSIATISINITPVNDAPVAVNDSYSIVQGSVLTVSLPGVLANDSDPDGNNILATRVTNATHGNAVLDNNANGGFTYTPTAGYSGPDSFTYTCSDGSLTSNVATVNITVLTPTGNSYITKWSCPHLVES